MSIKRVCLDRSASLSHPAKLKNEQQSRNVTFAFRFCTFSAHTKNESLKISFEGNRKRKLKQRRKWKGVMGGSPWARDFFVTRKLRKQAKAIRESIKCFRHQKPEQKRRNFFFVDQMVVQHTRTAWLSLLRNSGGWKNRYQCRTHINRSKHPRWIFPLNFDKSRGRSKRSEPTKARLE